MRQPLQVLWRRPGRQLQNISAHPARALAIVVARADRPFCRVEELVRVPGIGPVTLPCEVTSGGVCDLRKRPQTCPDRG